MSNLTGLGTRYKFKNWKITETRNQPVTEEMRRERAAEIAKQLNDTDRWHIHGYRISMEVLSKDLKLLIDDFGKDKQRSLRIRNYHDLLDDYKEIRENEGAVHVIGHYLPYQWEEDS